MCKRFGQGIWNSYFPQLHKRSIIKPFVSRCRIPISAGRLKYIICFHILCAGCTEVFDITALPVGNHARDKGAFIYAIWIKKPAQILCSAANPCVLLVNFRVWFNFIGQSAIIAIEGIITADTRKCAWVGIVMEIFNLSCPCQTHHRLIVIGSSLSPINAYWKRKPFIWQGGL